MVSNPWIGDPSIHVALALPFLVNLRELDLQGIRLRPKLWIAIQSHPTLVRLPVIAEDVLEGLPVCPRPSTHPPLVLGRIEYRQDDLDQILSNLALHELHVDSIRSYIDNSTLDNLLIFTRCTVAGLRSVTFDSANLNLDAAFLDDHQDLSADYVPLLFARNPTIRTIAICIPKAQRGQTRPFFARSLWKTLLDVPGLAALGNPELKWLWSGMGSAKVNGYFRFSEQDGAGRRTLERLCVPANLVTTRRDDLNIDTFTELVACLPDLRFIDLRLFDREFLYEVRLSRARRPLRSDE